MRSKSLPAHRTRPRVPSSADDPNQRRQGAQWVISWNAINEAFNYKFWSSIIRNTTLVYASEDWLICSSTSAFEVSPTPTDNIRFWCELCYVMIMQLFNKHIWDSHDCIPDVFVYNIIFDGILISSAEPNPDF